MSETEKTIGRTLAKAVNLIPSAEGRKYFLGYAEGAAAMAAELTDARNLIGQVVPDPQHEKRWVT